MTTFDLPNQQLNTQYNAGGNIYLNQQVPLHLIDARILAEAQQRLAALPLKEIPDVAPVPAGSRIPSFGSNSLFVGRETYMQALASLLKGDKESTINRVQIVAITGIGGLGKTQLMNEFVHRYGQYFMGGVFWLSFADADIVQAEIARCHTAADLEIPLNFGSLPLDDQVRLVLSIWQSPLPRLLVFDNCEDEVLLARWRPPTGGCRVVVTSRRPRWAPELGVNVLPLKEFSREESIKFLHKHRSDLSDNQLDSIAEALGDLPLALHLAGHFLNKYRDTYLGKPETYLKQVHQETLHHLSLQGKGVTYSATGHEQNIEKTFAISYEQLNTFDPIDKQALSLIARASYFAPGEPIPYHLLMETVGQIADGLLELQFEDALERLLELGLLEP